jgi:hypothetical protein
MRVEIERRKKMGEGEGGEGGGCVPDSSSF